MTMGHGASSRPSTRNSGPSSPSTIRSGRQPPGSRSSSSPIASGCGPVRTSTRGPNPHVSTSCSRRHAAWKHDACSSRMRMTPSNGPGRKHEPCRRRWAIPAHASASIRRDGLARCRVGPDNRRMATALPLASSQAWLDRARQVIPLASQTFSKAPNQFVRGASPVFLARGQGSHVWDVDGNEFIDYPTALGPIILGYNDPDVTAAVAAQLARGTIFSLPSPLEVEVAELVCEVVPCAEMVRFGKNGSDATAGAVRVARAATGREHIAVCGYHGWQDWYIGTTTRHRGVPKAVRELGPAI